MFTALKGSVVESSLTTSDNISVVIDGGDLLNTVKWPTDATYPEIATNYGKQVCTQFTGMPVIVVFDGYGSAATPTKNTEHQFRLQRTVSRDILFNASVKPFVPQRTAFSATRPTRHYTMFRKLIVSTALEAFIPVLVVAIETDILVLLVNQASGIHGGVYMGRGLTSCVSLDI